MIIGELLPYEHNETYIGRYMQEIRRQTLIEAANSFVPPGLGDAVPGARVVAVLVLEARAHHLVGVRGAGRY